MAGEKRCDEDDAQARLHAFIDALGEAPRLPEVALTAEHYTAFSMADPDDAVFEAGMRVKRTQGDTGVLVRRDERDDTETHGWWLVRLDDTYALNGGAPVQPEVWEHEDRLMPAEGKDHP